MVTERDYYDILRVKKNASPEEIKQAYRNLALQYHPDRNKSKDAEELFKEVNEAYAVLSDPQKRQQYDMMGSTQFGKAFTEQDIFRGFDFSKMFRDLGINIGFGFPGFGDNSAFGTSMDPNQLFDQLFGRGARVAYMKTCPSCGGSGAEKGSRMVTCSACNGRGQVTQAGTMGNMQFQISGTCQACGGRGKIPEKKCRNCGGRGYIEK